MIKKAAITCVAGYVPDKVISNFDLEKIVDTNDEWIRTRTGIQERRKLDDGLGSSFMGTKVAEQLLEKSGTNPNDIDLIICATVTPDYMFPATANIISYNIGATNAFSYDLFAACSGFLFALETGSNFITSGKYKKVMIIGADKMTSIVDYSDRNTCVLFGDGAGGVILEPSEDENGIIDSQLYTNGVGKDFLVQEAGGSVNPASEFTVNNKMHYIRQDGPKVFKAAVKGMADVSEEVVLRNNLKPEDIKYLVPHQANLRIIDAARERIGLDKEKVMININKYGNTTSGTIPLCLRDWEPQLKKGDNLILTSFGGGYTWGAIYLKWSYDSNL